MKWPRLTIRRLMIAVAIVGVVLGSVVRSWERSTQFERLSILHDKLVWNHMIWEWGYCLPLPTPRSEYHAKLFEKYRKAARLPWLPVASDPPLLAE